MGQNQSVAVIDYGMGNVLSVAKAFKLLDCDVNMTSDPNVIRKASHLVLPGVGAFGDGMAQLRKLHLDEVLNDEVVRKKKPFLGICLGMQLLARESEEFGQHDGLNFVAASVKKFVFNDRSMKVPHVGWNTVTHNEQSPIFSAIRQNAEFYFVHSYYVACDDEAAVTAWCEYGIRFAAAIQKDNIFATQFHPEKSQTKGMQLLKNFITLTT